MISSKEKAKLICHALSEKKGHHIQVIDIQKVSVLADYFIIVDGNNHNQVQAMADAVEEALQNQGIHARKAEGYANASWILMDYEDVVVHIFYQEDRVFYDLERVWRDGETLDTKQWERRREIESN